MVCHLYAFDVCKGGEQDDYNHQNMALLNLLTILGLVD